MNASDDTFEPTAGADLDWLAFQYVAGELPAADLVAFEDRLSRDEAACEAVVRAMQAAEATLAVLKAPVRSPAAASGGVAAWRRRIALTAAACLLLAAGLWWRAEANRPRPEVVTHERASEIVSLWTATGGDLDLPEQSEPPVEGEASDLDVPGWMLSAVEQDAKDEPEMEN